MCLMEMQIRILLIYNYIRKYDGSHFVKWKITEKQMKFEKRAKKN